jgi:hypothetical protein
LPLFKEGGLKGSFHITEGASNESVSVGIVLGFKTGLTVGKAEEIIEGLQQASSIVETKADPNNSKYTSRLCWYLTYFPAISSHVDAPIFAETRPSAT